ncbi:MAG: PAS domain-containing protein, partial [Sphingopyxis terrae]
GLQDTTERQFNEINREILAVELAIERHLASPHPPHLSLREDALRALDDDGDILRIIGTVDGVEMLSISPTTPETAPFDVAGIAWSTTDTAFPFGSVNIGDPIILVDGATHSVPMRYRFLADVSGVAVEIIALTDATQILHGYESVELAEGSAFALFRADGVLLARWPDMARYVGRKFNGPIFGHHLQLAPSATIRAQIETDNKERILTYRTTRGWPLVVVAGAPVRGLLASWLASLPGKSLLLLFILSAIFLLWVALRSSQSALRRSVEELTVNEGRYARLLANIPGGVFTRRFVPPDRIEYTFASQGFRDTFGSTTGPASADTDVLLALIHPDDRRKVFDSILASREGDEVLTQEFRAIKPSGQLMWVQSVARRYRGEDGAILWDGVAVDITDLRQQQALLENVQKIAGLGYWIWHLEPDNDSGDLSRRRTHYSPACAAILGFRPEDMRITDAEFVTRIVHPEDRESVRREYQRFLDIENAPHDIQYRI